MLEGIKGSRFIVRFTSRLDLTTDHEVRKISKGLRGERVYESLGPNL